MTKFCPNCGEKLIDDANFCKSCGTRLNASAERTAPPQRPAYEKDYTIHIIIAYILALLIPLFGLVMGFYLLSRKDSEKAKKHGKYAIIVSIVMMALSFINVLRYY